MKFIKLMKSKLFKAKKKKKINWTLDEEKYLNLDEVRRLRKSCKGKNNTIIKKGEYIPIRNWFMIELGLNTGLRVSEMAKVKYSDMFLEKDKASIIVRSGKGGRKRAVSISLLFKKECLWYLNWKSKTGQGIDEESYILTSRRGNKLTCRALQCIL